MGLFLLSGVMLVGMWLERFIIVVVSLHRDFLTSSWGMYYPTRWDWMTYIGTIGLFLAAMFLFVRMLPMISIFEMRTLLPEAEVKRNEAHPDLRHDGGIRFRPHSGGGGQSHARSRLQEDRRLQSVSDGRTGGGDRLPSRRSAAGGADRRD